MILQTKFFCCGHYTKLSQTLHFWEHIFVIQFLVSAADCGYVHLFCSYLYENEAVKLSFTLFMFCYNQILLYICPTDLVSCNTSQILFCYPY